MTRCWCCNGAHDHTECPLFGKPEEFVSHVMSPPAQEPSSSSLAPTLLEQLYGADARAALQLAADDDRLTDEQRELALEISSGMKPIQSEDPEFRAQLDDIATHLASAPRRPDASRSRDPQSVRPGYVSTWQEQEDFGDTAGGALQPASDPYQSVNRASEPADEPK